MDTLLEIHHACHIFFQFFTALSIRLAGSKCHITADIIVVCRVVPVDKTLAVQHFHYPIKNFVVIHVDRLNIVSVTVNTEKLRF